MHLSQNSSQNHVYKDTQNIMFILILTSEKLLRPSRLGYTKSHHIQWLYHCTVSPSISAAIDLQVCTRPWKEGECPIRLWEFCYTCIKMSKCPCIPWLLTKWTEERVMVAWSCQNAWKHKAHNQIDACMSSLCHNKMTLTETEQVEVA